jgi:hypothetical protein
MVPANISPEQRITAAFSNPAFPGVHKGLKAINAAGGM